MAAVSYWRASLISVAARLSRISATIMHEAAVAASLLLVLATYPVAAKSIEFKTSLGSERRYQSNENSRAVASVEIESKNLVITKEWPRRGIFEKITFQKRNQKTVTEGVLFLSSDRKRYELWSLKRRPYRIYFFESTSSNFVEKDLGKQNGLVSACADDQPFSRGAQGFRELAERLDSQGCDAHKEKIQSALRLFEAPSGGTDFYACVAEKFGEKKLLDEIEKDIRIANRNFAKSAILCRDTIERGERAAYDEEKKSILLSGLWIQAQGQAQKIANKLAHEYLHKHARKSIKANLSEKEIDQFVDCCGWGQDKKSCPSQKTQGAHQPSEKIMANPEAAALIKALHDRPEEQKKAESELLPIIEKISASDCGAGSSANGVCKELKAKLGETISEIHRRIVNDSRTPSPDSDDRARMLRASDASPDSRFGGVASALDREGAVQSRTDDISTNRVPDMVHRPGRPDRHAEVINLAAASRGSQAAKIADEVDRNISESVAQVERVIERAESAILPRAQAADLPRARSPEREDREDRQDRSGRDDSERSSSTRSIASRADSPEPTYRTTVAGSDEKGSPKLAVTRRQESSTYQPFANVAGVDGRLGSLSAGGGAAAAQAPGGTGAGAQGSLGLDEVIRGLTPAQQGQVAGRTAAGRTQPRGQTSSGSSAQGSSAGGGIGGGAEGASVGSVVSQEGSSRSAPSRQSASTTSANSNEVIQQKIDRMRTREPRSAGDVLGMIKEVGTPEPLLQEQWFEQHFVRFGIRIVDGNKVVYPRSVPQNAPPARTYWNMKMIAPSGGARR